MIKLTDSNINSIIALQKKFRQKKYKNESNIKIFIEKYINSLIKLQIKFKNYINKKKFDKKQLRAINEIKYLLKFNKIYRNLKNVYYSFDYNLNFKKKFEIKYESFNLNYNYLNDNCFINIFSFLSLNENIKLKRVCKKFNNFFIAPIFLNNLICNQLNLDKIEFIKDNDNLKFNQIILNKIIKTQKLVYLFNDYFENIKNFAKEKIKELKFTKAFKYCFKINFIKENFKLFIKNKYTSNFIKKDLWAKLIKNYLEIMIIILDLYIKFNEYRSGFIFSIKMVNILDIIKKNLFDEEYFLENISIVEIKLCNF